MCARIPKQPRQESVREALCFFPGLLQLFCSAIICWCILCTSISASLFYPLQDHVKLRKGEEGTRNNFYLEISRAQLCWRELMHYFKEEEKLPKDFGTTTVVGIELAVCIHSHFLVYPYLCDSGLLQPYVCSSTLFFPFWKWMCERADQMWSCSRKSKVFCWTFMLCQEKLVNYFFANFDGSFHFPKVTLNIFLDVQIAENV